VQRFAPLFADAARPCRHAPGDRWCGLKRLRSAGVIAGGHTFVQNLRRGHYELAIDIAAPPRLAEAFTELALAV
jgi:hypothetical protein